MSRYKKMNVNELDIDDRYQRQLDEKWVATIEKNFDEALFGVLEVSQRNGRSAVFDGQHRLVAARQRGLLTVPCLVHSDLTPEDEADLFVALQRKRKGILPVDRFKARVFAGDETAVAVNEIVLAAGFKVYQGSGMQNGRQRQIAAVSALERCYARGTLRETLELIGDTWGGDDASTDGKLIDGVSILLAGYGHRIDLESRDRLRKFPPVAILRRALSRAEKFGGNPTRHGTLVAGELRKVLGLRGRPSSPKELSNG